MIEQFRYLCRDKSLFLIFGEFLGAACALVGIPALVGLCAIAFGAQP